MESPAVGSQGGPGVLDAYVHGSNAHIYHRFYISARWSNYYDLGGDFNIDPVAGSFGPGTAIVVTLVQLASQRPLPGSNSNPRRRALLGQADQRWQPGHRTISS
jgi:hypothetical protein